MRDNVRLDFHEKKPLPISLYIMIREVGFLLVTNQQGCLMQILTTLVLFCCHRHRRDYWLLFTLPVAQKVCTQAPQVAFTQPTAVFTLPQRWSGSGW
jgi:hypothetical protein